MASFYRRFTLRSGYKNLFIGDQSQLRVLCAPLSFWPLIVTHLSGNHWMEMFAKSKRGPSRRMRLIEDQAQTVLKTLCATCSSDLDNGMVVQAVTGLMSLLLRRKPLALGWAAQFRAGMVDGHSHCTPRLYPFSRPFRRGNLETPFSVLLYVVELCACITQPHGLTWCDRTAIATLFC